MPSNTTNNSKKEKLVTLVIIAMLLTLDIILSRFLSLPTTITKISFSFVPTCVALRYFGIKAGVIVNGLGDLIGALLFPIGAYFVGYTITAMIWAVIFGLFISKKISFVRILLAVLSTQIVCTLLLNTMWTSMLYGSGFLALLPARLQQSAVMTIAQVIVIYILLVKNDKLFKKLIPTHYRKNTT